MALNDPETGNSRDPGRDPLLDRAYAGGTREEPPVRLDAAILAAARREVGARPRPLGAAWRSWRMPVSIAAVLVLSATLVSLMREEGADRIDDAALTQPAPAPPRQTSPATPGAPAPAAPEQRSAPPARAAAPARTPAPAARKEEDRARRDTAPPPPSVADAARPAEGAEARPFAESKSSVEERQAASPPARGPASGTLAKEAEVGAAAQGRALERSAPAAAPPMAAKLKPAPLEAARAERAPAASREPAPPWSGFERQPPEKWVERIEELRRAGHQAEAREMLEEFKKRFPGHPLPAALTQ